MTPHAQRPRGAGHLRVTALLLVAALLVLTSAGGASARPGQETAPAQLRTREVSTWVAPDGEFSATFEIPDGIPLDAEITTTVHQPLSTRGTGARAGLERLLNGDAPGRPLQRPIRTPLATAVDGSGGFVVRVPIRSRSGDSDRLLLPNAGVHPVTVTIVTADGRSLARAVVFLVRVPADAGRQAGGVGLLLKIDDTAAPVGPDGEPRVRLDARSAITTAVGLATAGGGAMTVAARPSLLDATERSDAAGAAVVRSLRDAVRNGSVLRTASTRIDTSAVSAVGTDLLDAEVAAADAVHTRLLEKSGGRTWGPDDTLDSRATQALVDRGIDRFVLRAPQVRLENDDPVPARLGSAKVLTLDERLGVLLLDGTRSSAATANLVSALSAASWFDQGGPATLAVEVASGTAPATLTKVVSELSNSPIMPLTPIDRLFDLATDDNPSARLIDAVPGDTSRVIGTVLAERARLDAVRSMLPDQDTRGERLEALISGSLTASLTPAERDAYLASLTSELNRLVGGVSPPGERTVTVTSRDATIPLRLTNSLDVPVTVAMDLRSPLLEFPDGRSRELRLDPGENRIDLRVRARGSGQLPLTITIRTPSGSVRLAESRVNVRSTVVSGVGAALSIGALLVLLMWWVMTTRRSRRAARADHPSGTPPADNRPSVDESDPSSAHALTSGSPGGEGGAG